MTEDSETASKSNVGISSSAFEHACSEEMKLIPIRTSISSPAVIGVNRRTTALSLESGRLETKSDRAHSSKYHFRA